MTDPGRPLRVHFFTSYVHEQGTYFRYHNLAVGLTRLGHAVTVYGCDVDPTSRPRREVRDGVPYDIVPESWKASVFSEYNHPLTTVRRAVRGYPRCDVAHLFQPFLAAAAGWRRCPARVRFYDWDDQWTGGLISGPVRSWRERWPRLVIGVLEKRLPRWAGHVTAISHYLADRATGLGARQVTLVNSGAWPATPPTAAAARVSVGLRADALYAGFMGYTVAEMPWCYAGLAAHLGRHPRLRLAICGAPPPGLADQPAEVRDRIDYLGRLPVGQARVFAAALDLALIPLADSTFNRSRLPQKYGDHLMSGVPVLCSDVGECGRLNPHFPSVFRAGTTADEWVAAFGRAIDRLAAGDRPPADLPALARRLSWDSLSQNLLSAYRRALGEP